MLIEITIGSRIGSAGSPLYPSPRDVQSGVENALPQIRQKRATTPQRTEIYFGKTGVCHAAPNQERTSHKCSSGCYGHSTRHVEPSQILATEQIDKTVFDLGKNSMNKNDSREQNKQLARHPVQSFHDILVGLPRWLAMYCDDLEHSLRC